MGDQLKHLLRGWGPETRVAVCRFTPGASPALQTFLENRGFASVTRTGAGAWTAQLIDTKVKSIEAFAWEIENDTTIRHRTRVDSFSATAGTIAVTHKVSTYASEASAVVVPLEGMTDVAAATVAYGVSPIAGTITLCQTQLTSGGATNGDAILTFAIGGVAITNGAVTIASGSAVNEVDSASPTAANTVAVGSKITATSDGGGSTTTAANVQVLVQGTGATPAGSDTVDQIVILAFYRVMA